MQNDMTPIHYFSAHTCDEDCDPYLQLDGICRVCGTLHFDPCVCCGGTGFHRDSCELANEYDG